MKITTVGIDLAKNVFQVHGVDERGKVVLRRQLRREQMVEFFARLSPCLVGMEACGSAHHWARMLQAQGHSVRVIASQFVKPYAAMPRSLPMRVTTNRRAECAKCWVSVCSPPALLPPRCPIPRSSDTVANSAPGWG